ncbi:hypothetical protein LguiA_018438 [Lonicera macranthoides]
MPLSISVPPIPESLVNHPNHESKASSNFLSLIGPNCLPVDCNVTCPSAPTSP